MIKYLSKEELEKVKRFNMNARKDDWNVLVLNTERVISGKRYDISFEIYKEYNYFHWSIMLYDNTTDILLTSIRSVHVYDYSLPDEIIALKSEIYSLIKRTLEKCNVKPDDCVYHNNYYDLAFEELLERYIKEREV